MFVARAKERQPRHPLRIINNWWVCVLATALCLPSTIITLIWEKQIPFSFFINKWVLLVLYSVQVVLLFFSAIYSHEWFALLWKRIFTNLKLNSIFSLKDTSSSPPLVQDDPFAAILVLVDKLRSAVQIEPENEREVQDVFEALLIGAGLEYSREKEHIPYSSRTYRPDFIIPDINLAIDLKFCNHSSRESKIIQELNDYTLAFQSKYERALFIVYDVGQIRDVDSFLSPYQHYLNVIVKVVKH